MRRLSETNIEYFINSDGSRGYVWNFGSGCTNSETGHCPLGDLCWAKKLTERFKAHYPNGFKPTLYPEALLSPLSLTKPSKIGVCFMGDIGCLDPDAELTLPHYRFPKLFTEINLKLAIGRILKECPQHTFLFLTKRPDRLHLWAPFPQNAWLGVSVWNDASLNIALNALDTIICGKRYISVEPILDPVHLDHPLTGTLDWVVIGSLTGPKTAMLEANNKYPDLTLMPYEHKWSLQPPIAWVKEIVEAADKAGIPVWIKNNLEPSFRQCTTLGYNWLWSQKIGHGELWRQELPQEESKNES